MVEMRQLDMREAERIANLVPGYIRAARPFSRASDQEVTMSNTQGSTNKGNQKGGDQKPLDDKKGNQGNEKTENQKPPNGPQDRRPPPQGK